MLIKSLPYCHVLLCLCLHHVFHLLHPQHPAPLYSARPPTHTHNKCSLSGVCVGFSICCSFHTSEVSKFKKSTSHHHSIQFYSPSCHVSEDFLSFITCRFPSCHILLSTSIHRPSEVLDVLLSEVSTFRFEPPLGSSLHRGVF